MALQGLIDSLERTVRKLEPRPSSTAWGNYYEDTNYSDAGFEHKRALVTKFITEIAPESVWDLGANDGAFSRLASDTGIATIAIDGDPVAVEKNALTVRERKETHLLPLLVDLTNPSPALGWDNSERLSLRERGPVDLVLALALVHHFAIGNNVPLPRIAEFLWSFGRALIVEFVPKSDSQVQRLLESREDIFPSYTDQGFEAAFAGFFNMIHRVQIKGTERILYLFERSELGPA